MNKRMIIVACVLAVLLGAVPAFAQPVTQKDIAVTITYSAPVELVMATPPWTLDVIKGVDTGFVWSDPYVITGLSASDGTYRVRVSGGGPANSAEWNTFVGADGLHINGIAGQDAIWRSELMDAAITSVAYPAALADPSFAFQPVVLPGAVFPGSAIFGIDRDLLATQLGFNGQVVDGNISVALYKD